MNKIGVTLIFVAVVLVLAISGFFIFGNNGQEDINDLSNEVSNIPTPDNIVDNSNQQPINQPPQDNMPNVQNRNPNPIFDVSSVELIFTGGYADPSVIKDGNRYLMYLNTFSTPKGTGIYVLSSNDFVNWEEETGIIFTGIATARSFRFDEGIRVYYPKDGEIKSSISSNGLTSFKEDNTKISPKSGFNNEGPTVFILPDGNYRMYFNNYAKGTGEHGTIRTGEIYGATSSDGINWEVDANPTIVFEDAVEGLGMKGLPAQVLHPFVIEMNDEYLMFYNAHSEVFAAKSNDGITWEKMGYVGIHGADVDAVALDDGSLRIYYGDFSEETQGIVYTAVLKVG